MMRRLLITSLLVAALIAPSQSLLACSRKLAKRVEGDPDEYQTTRVIDEWSKTKQSNTRSGKSERKVMDPCRRGGHRFSVRLKLSVWTVFVRD